MQLTFWQLLSIHPRDIWDKLKVEWTEKFGVDQDTSSTEEDAGNRSRWIAVDVKTLQEDPGLLDRLFPD